MLGHYLIVRMQDLNAPFINIMNSLIRLFLEIVEKLLEMYTQSAVFRFRLDQALRESVDLAYHNLNGFLVLFVHVGDGMR